MSKTQALRCKMVISLALAGALAGCAVTEPVMLQSDYGRSVSQMTSAQLYNPAAALKPSPKPVKGMDGTLGQNVMRNYRYVPNPADVLRSEVTFKRQ